MAKAKVAKVKKKQKSPFPVVLYLFLLPMFISTIVSLFASNYLLFAKKIVGFLLLYGAINLIDRGLKQEYEYKEATIAQAPKVKYKFLGSLGLGVFVLYMSLVVDNLSIINTIALTTLAVVGSVLFYGADPNTDKLPQKDGVNYNKLLKDLNEAQEKIDFIKKQNENIEDIELKEALKKAVYRAEEILNTIKQDPKDIRVARKFMVVYLDGLKDVINQYNSIKGHLDDSFRIRLIELLNDASIRFEKELDRLKSNEIFDLDVQIDALKEQLKD